MTASTIPSIGIDFGGTSIKMGVVKGAEVIAHAPSIATQEYGNPDQLIEAIAQFVNMLRLNHPEVQAIGMGMPGFVNFYQGTVYTLTNVPGWNNVPVRDMLQAACGLPVYVENDANCMAYAEWKLGAGKGKRHLVCLTLGTGVGSGLIVNGELLRGSTCSAGELGQTSIDYRGRLGHCHIASAQNSRLVPQPWDGQDYLPFFQALAAMGYEGRLSLEGDTRGGLPQIRSSLAYLRQLTGQAAQ